MAFDHPDYLAPRLKKEYCYTSTPSGPSWPVIGRTWPFTFSWAKLSSPSHPLAPEFFSIPFLFSPLLLGSLQQSAYTGYFQCRLLALSISSPIIWSPHLNVFREKNSLTFDGFCLIRADVLGGARVWSGFKFCVCQMPSGYFLNAEGSFTCLEESLSDFWGRCLVLPYVQTFFLFFVVCVLLKTEDLAFGLLGPCIVEYLLLLVLE